MKRILSAVVFIPVFYAIVRLPPPYFGFLAAAATVLALLEFYRLAAARGIRCHRAAGVLLALATLYSFFRPAFPLALPLAVGLATVPILSLLGRRPLSESLGPESVTVFAALFLGTMFGFQIALRGVGEEVGGDLIFVLFLVVWTGDAAAYYFGSAFGRRLLSPQVSPHKTVEGAAAGVLASIGAALLARVWFFPQFSVPDCVVLGVLLAMAGILGDLVESMWKRAAGAKDSASLVPGHGGILDRSDSLLFGGPILYYYYSLWVR